LCVCVFVCVVLKRILVKLCSLPAVGPVGQWQKKLKRILVKLCSLPAVAPVSVR